MNVFEVFVLLFHVGVFGATALWIGQWHAWPVAVLGGLLILCFVIGLEKLSKGWFERRQ